MSFDRSFMSLDLVQSFTQPITRLVRASMITLLLYFWGGGGEVQQIGIHKQTKNCYD